MLGGLIRKLQRVSISSGLRVDSLDLRDISTLEKSNDCVEHVALRAAHRQTLRRVSREHEPAEHDRRFKEIQHQRGEVEGRRERRSNAEDFEDQRGLNWHLETAP